MNNIKQALISGFMVFLANIAFVGTAHSTIVRIETNLGNIDVNLFDETTPITVANFLRYTNDGVYDNSTFHRLVNDFVIQGGGFRILNPDSQNFEAEDLPVFEEIQNEPVWSNQYGTIAMAKRGGAPNSATSQWYINLKDNSESLDPDVFDSQGYTVFGQVVENYSFETLNAINELLRFNYGVSPYEEVPILDYTQDDYNNGVVLTSNNLLHILSVAVIDNNVSSADVLTPVENTLIDQVPEPEPEPETETSGTFWLLLLLPLVIVARRR